MCECHGVNRRQVFAAATAATMAAPLVAAGAQSVPGQAGPWRSGTMRAAVLKAPHQPIDVMDVPFPNAPGPDEAILRVEACGICRSDWHNWNGDFGWFKDFPGASFKVSPWLDVERVDGRFPGLPYIPGHEVGGVVEEVGANVRQLKRGDRVVIPFHESCGACYECRSGNANLCTNGKNYPNGWGQYTKVVNADLNCLKLPDGIDTLTGAALGCRFMTSFHAVMHRGRVKGGEWVGVFGCGGIGLSAVQIAASVGAQVIAVDIDETKLAMAKAQGAVATVNAAKVPDVVKAVRELSSGGVHVSIDALGGSKTTLPGLLSLRRRGRLVLVGLTSQEDKGYISVPVDFMIGTEWEIVGSLGNPHQHYAEIFSMIQRGKLNPKSLITRQVSLSEVNGVVESMTAFKTVGLNVITKFA